MFIPSEVNFHPLTSYSIKMMYTFVRWESDGQVSREVWEKAGAAGLLGVSTPEEIGGVGGDILTASIVWDEQ